MNNKYTTTLMPLSVTVLLPILLIVLLSACSEQILNKISSSGTISQAVWNSNTGQLLVTGSTTKSTGIVVIADADSGNQISLVISESGKWRVVTSSAICNVQVSFSDRSTQHKTVENAPSACQQLSSDNISHSRALRPAALGSNVEPLFNTPNGIIISPQSNAIINVGESINFVATATDPLGRSPIKYIWNFAGAIPNSLAQNPGDVIFNKIGTYKITLTTVNNDGTPDPTPATKLIVVNGNNAPQAAAPIANIVSPASATTIFVGDSLTFLGEGAGQGIQNSAELTYTWDFGASITQPIANIQAQSPGSLVFMDAGQFTIQLNVTNVAGVQSKLPAEIIVNALPVNANLPPIGIIDSPPLDVVINAGETLFFSVVGADANGSANLNYSWNFGILPTANLQQQTPGLVTFPNPGLFTIGLSLTDPQGLVAPVDVSRVITVLAADPNNQLVANNAILSPLGDMTLLIGESVTFTGEVTTDDPNAAVVPLSYLWMFDGAAPDSTELSPGDIALDIPGEFDVKFTVINANGLKVGATVEREIRVKQVTATITSPATKDVMINVGETIDFTSAYEVLNLAPDQSVSFLWQFDRGIAPNSIEQNAGPVTFNTLGEFEVEFNVMVIDALGIEIDHTDVEVEVLVIDPNAPLPTATITSPAVKKMTINIGETIDFTGAYEVLNLAPDQTVSFLWEFDRGIALNSIEQSAGPVTFDVPGEFEVKFNVIVIDAVGIEMTHADAEVEIMVIDPNAPILPPPANNLQRTPNGILNPSEDLMIEVGNSVTFDGVGIDIGSTGQVVYEWELRKKGPRLAIPMPDITEQNPGPVIFDQLGEYRIKYQAKGIDANGQRVKVKGERKIMVVDIGALPTATPTPIPAVIPVDTVAVVTGVIVSPVSDMTIEVGQSVNFAGEGRAPNGGAVAFVWNFAGATLNSASQNPGIVTFNRTGVFTISLTVIDSAGNRDPNPPSVTITVTDANGNI